MRTIAEQARERREKVQREYGWSAVLRKTARVCRWISATAIIVGGPVALWQSGKTDQWLETARSQAIDASARFGMVINTIDVAGRHRTDPNALLAAIGQKPGSPIITFDADAARERIEQLSWVRKASVERRLPDTIIIHVEERQPLALWQHGDNHILIDADGVQLQDYELGDYLNLPVLVGEDAPEHAAAMMATLKTVPRLFDMVTGAQRIGHRRWNVQLSNGMFIRLPEHDMDKAWTRLDQLDQAHNLLESDVLVVDLRLADRTFVRLTPGAAELRRNPPKEKKGSV
ncbi:cell division protein FtsQ/DivIB [Thalassospira marina]|uniref:Cell division protein FtsQ n=1 Tax=Thalassospira marina TaxID=2048283 RepID=A0A2N3KWI6_9PROT|nr:FtsQ-type POTRA domain-containing protein [Thalassospira marina]AUG53797.1 cell division protein FtsQ [Thalassospira marina]PKR54945.1 cell division protein FtsQ [Thalassospira marina]